MLEGIDIPTAPVQHPVEPGPLPTIQAAIGPHPGFSSAQARRLIFQAAKFSGSQLTRPHAPVYPTFLIQFPPVDV
jgi:hypothetical protein